MKHSLACLLLAFSTAALGQAWPSKPVRIVVAYPPGGGIDVMARQLADKLQPAWGQPVVVENKPGANTIVAADSVAKSAPDAHTILMTTDATFSINPHLYSKLPYDARRVSFRRPCSCCCTSSWSRTRRCPRQPAGIDRPGEKAKPGHQLRLLRQRQPAASCWRDAQAQGRHRSGARAVQGDLAGGAGGRGGRGAAHLCRHRHLHAATQGGTHQGARDRRAEPYASSPRCRHSPSSATRRSRRTRGSGSSFRRARRARR